MPATDPRVDAYIEKAKDFAKPVLTHIRELVHEACPDVTETMKWSFPHFDYKGMMCSMASFNEHCAFGFWKQSLLEQSAFPAEKTAMGSFGRITSLKDLPNDKTMKKLIVDAARLNDEGIKISRPVSKEKKELVVPEILTAALRTNALAAETFNEFPILKEEGVRRLDHRSQNRRDTRQASRDHNRVAGGGQGTKLEIRKVLNTRR